MIRRFLGIPWPSITLSTVTRGITIVCAIVLAAASTVAADDGSSNYRGVVPGAGHAPPRAAAMKGSAVLLTWPGFQPKADGSSRFFLQTSQPVETEQKASKNRFELLLRRTRVHLGNTLRPLVTRHFETPVVRAKVKRRGRKGTAIVFDLREEVTPTISHAVEKDGYHYVYIDFPAPSP